MNEHVNKGKQRRVQRVCAPARGAARATREGDYTTRGTPQQQKQRVLHLFACSV